jgi:hypothetical protein
LATRWQEESLVGRGQHLPSQMTGNALYPGSSLGSKAAVWQLGQVEMKDSGQDGVRGNADDEVFATQGVFLP